MNIVEIRHVESISLDLHEQITKAKNLVAGKTIAKCSNQREKVSLQITVRGRTILHTSIYLIDKEKLAYAYYCNGAFWRSTDKQQIELI